MRKIDNNIYDVIISNKLFSSAFKYIVQNNNSNFAPYHNFNHMMLVTQKILDAHRYIDNYVPYSNLILAGMFHDMNHSMGKENDEQNVNNAVDALKTWWKLSGKSLDQNELNVNINESVDILRATQYPYVIPDEKLNIGQQIIRDSDLLIMLNDNWFQNLIGLNNELDINDMSKILEGSIEFYENVSMRTDWAKKIHKEEWRSFMSRLRRYNSLFKQNERIPAKV
tara:strand:+ start:159729 stop:160403 length:675 start_codon:yes stop_codon:yes gene_type:complete